MRIVWIAAPPLAVTLALAIFAAAEMAGAHPLTQGPPRNAAEAVAMHDHAAVLRFAAPPAAAAAIAMIRRDILTDRPMFVSPAETAVLVHDREALDLLASRGGWSDADRAHLACLARDVHDAALTAFFDTDGSVACAEGDGLARVLRRP
jgi:hypothetical protein